MKSPRQLNWLTGAAGGSGPNLTAGNASHCSAFAAGAADVLGVYLLRPPDASDLNLANNQADWLATNPSGWYAVTAMTNAQHLANLGVGFGHLLAEADWRVGIAPAIVALLARWALGRVGQRDLAAGFRKGSGLDMNHAGHRRDRPRWSIGP